MLPSFQNVWRDQIDLGHRCMTDPGGYLGSVLLGMCRWPLRAPAPIIVYFVASYRPHLSHFWENVIFAIPTKSLSIYASTLFWTGGFVLLCNWFIEVVVSRTECNAR